MTGWNGPAFTFLLLMALTIVPPMAVADASAAETPVTSGDGQDACAGLVPDLAGVDRDRLGPVSAHLVETGADAIEACKDASDEEPAVDRKLRLAIALAASPETAAEGRKLAGSLAADGNPQARNLYASMLSNGIGGPVNDVQAAIAYHLAAAGGVPEAMFSFGILRWHGKGLPQDRLDARTWLERAIAKGDPEAMSFLGLQLLTGNSLVADQPRGLELIHRALDAKGIRSASDASMAYAYLASISGGKDTGLPPHAATSEQVSRNRVTYLGLAADAGDRISMIGKAGALPADEARSLLEAASRPPEAKARLAAWLTRASLLLRDDDQAVYKHLLAERGTLSNASGIDAAPYIEQVAARLDPPMPATGDGIDVPTGELVKLWNESVRACAATPAAMEAYLTCAWNKAVAQLLWSRGWCPTDADDEAWRDCRLD